MDRGSAVIAKATPPDDQRESRLCYLEQMDQINSVLEDTEDWQQLSRVCDVLVAIFRCDRVWIARPYDPEHPTWRPGIVCGSAEIFSSSSVGLELPMGAELAQMHRVVMGSRTAVQFGAGAENPIAEEIAERFGVRSQFCLAIHPKADRSYIFGLDQCTTIRIWSEAEKRLFEATGQRLALLLTRWGMARELQDSKARLEEAQRVARVGHWEWDLETGDIVWSDESYRIFGFRPHERPMDLATVRAMVHPDDRESLYGNVDKDLAAGVRPDAEFRIVLPSGEVRTIHALTSKHWVAPTGYPPRDPAGSPPYKLFGTMRDITDRKREEEERQALSRTLQESRQWLEEAQRVAHIGYWIWYLDKNQVIYSAETCRIFGLTPQEGPIDLAIVSERIHPDDREWVFRQAEEAIRSGTRVDTVHRIVRPDGEVRTIEALGDLKKDASGRPYQMFGTTQDVTERKRAEEALQRSEFYLSAGERIAHIGSWAINDSGHYWSDELYKIYAVDPKDGVPTVDQYLALIHPQDRAAVAESIRLMQDEHRGFDQIERIIRPDGQLRYIHAVAVPVVEQGLFKGFIGTTMDVTEQELLAEELRRERAYLAEAQSLTHTGSWAANFLTEQNYHLSDEIYRLHGFDSKQGPLPLDRFWTTVHPEDEPTVRAVITSAIDTRSDYDIPEYRICLPDGSIRFLRSIGHSIPSGAVGDYIGITMDVTERKRAEEERERLRKLEHDLAHINRVNMMGELAAALAHEIKQPISATITSANALLRWLAHDPPDLDRARAIAARIAQEGNRAADIMNSVRSFYKMGAVAERNWIDLNEVIDEMTVLLGTEASRNAVTIQTALEPLAASIRTDRVQLQQVLMNLMLNAIEAMKDTGGELWIRSTIQSEGHILVSISDCGKGLPAESADRIFEPFHTTKPHGTGMGLTITRSIVEANGGRVWATSNSSVGATFHFTLPCDADRQV
jgi:PAS domain S-box-containing protein